MTTDSFNRLIMEYVEMGNFAVSFFYLQECFCLVLHASYDLGPKGKFSKKILEIFCSHKRMKLKLLNMSMTLPSTKVMFFFLLSVSDCFRCYDSFKFSKNYSRISGKFCSFLWEKYLG